MLINKKSTVFFEGILLFQKKKRVTKSIRHTIIEICPIGSNSVATDLRKFGVASPSVSGKLPFLKYSLKNNDIILIENKNGIMPLKI